MQELRPAHWRWFLVCYKSILILWHHMSRLCYHSCLRCLVTLPPWYVVAIVTPTCIKMMWLSTACAQVGSTVCGCGLNFSYSFGKTTLVPQDMMCSFLTRRANKILLLSKLILIEVIVTVLDSSVEWKDRLL